MTGLGAPAARVAVISLHTSPLDQPGTGDAGGMNVEVRAVAERLAGRGVEVDVFTRCAGRGVPEVETIGPGARVIQIPAGPCAEVDKLDLPELVSPFAAEVTRRGTQLGPYDLVHAHYWLSGDGGISVARRWRVPLVLSFHTLGEVKVRAGAGLEPADRRVGERRAVEVARRIVVPTEAEVRALTELYEADPSRIRVVPPGVDGSVFFPRPRQEARARLHLGPGPVVLFVGRLQELKGPDVAIRAFGEAVGRDPGLMREATLLMVGGPSGDRGADVIRWLEGIAGETGVAPQVRFLPPQPHPALAWTYAAADVLVMPSRSESFGLTALEAQASGVPVVATRVGGLAAAVRDGFGGYLVDRRDPAAYAERILALLSSPDLAMRLRRGAIEHAARFPWDRTVDDLVGVYAEFVPTLAAAAAS